MKRFKLVALLAAISLLSASTSFAGYDEGAFVNKKLESGGTSDTPVRVYTLVRNPSFGALGGIGNIGFSTGDVLIWDPISDDGITVNEVGRGGITLCSDAVAGVAVGEIPTADVQASSAAADVGRRNWGYVQVYGLHTTVKTDTSTIDVGEGLRASNTARRARGSNDNASGGDEHYPASLGFAYDATSSETTVEAFVRTQ